MYVPYHFYWVKCFTFSDTFIAVYKLVTIIQFLHLSAMAHIIMLELEGSNMATTTECWDSWMKMNLLQHRLPRDAPTREKSAYFWGHRKRIKVEDETRWGINDNKPEMRNQTRYKWQSIIDRERKENWINLCVHWIFLATTQHPLLGERELKHFGEKGKCKEIQHISALIWAVLQR